MKIVRHPATKINLAQSLERYLGFRTNIEADMDGGVIRFSLFYLDIASHGDVVANVYGIALGTALARIRWHQP